MLGKLAALTNHMAPSRHRALHRRGKHVSREEDKPLSSAVRSGVPSLPQIVQHRGELGHVDGIAGAWRQLLRVDAIHIVEVEEGESARHGGQKKAGE